MRKVFYNTGPIAHMSNWDSKLRLDEEVKSENIHPIGNAIICKDNVIEKIVTSEEAVEEFPEFEKEMRPLKKLVL